MKRPSFILQSLLAPSPSWTGQVFQLALATLLGLILGLSVSKLQPLVILGVAAVLGLGGLYAMVRVPELTVSAFWAAYIFQSTIFVNNFEVKGLYYPIYLVMILNVPLVLNFVRFRAPWRLISLFLGFYLVVVINLFYLPTGPSFQVWQRLFIIGLGLLCAFQFASYKSLKLFPRVQALVAMSVATWVVISSVQGGFAYRGGLGSSINENNVSLMIALGVIPLIARLLGNDKRVSVLERVLILVGAGGCVYAMLLLASRGMTMGLAIVLLIFLLRISLNLKKSLPIFLVIVVLATVLVNLPGSSNLTERFSSAEVESFNNRLPLWEIVIDDFLVAGPRELLIGHGFDSAEILLSRYVRHTSTHNVYLQMLYEFGIVGLLLFLSLHAALLASVWRFKSSLGLTVVGLIMCLLLANLTATAADNFIYWVVLGYCMAASFWLNQPQAALEPRPKDLAF